MGACRSSGWTGGPRAAAAWAAAWLGLAAVATGDPGAAAPSSDQAAHVGGLASLRRQVHQFDFENVDDGRVGFPSAFYRHVAAEDGYLPFGSMRLTTEQAANGQGSFEFTLQGGSMAARVPTGVIPVMPPGDYVVTAMVRTRGLVTARAQVAAWYADDRGRAVPGTEFACQPVETGDRWVPITLPAPCESPAAVDLVIELRLVQRKLQGGGTAAPDEPILDDISGTAWFDDVIVWQLPRIELSTGSPWQLAAAGEPVRLRLLVDDRTDQTLTAQLRVTDLDGMEVRRQEMPAPRGAQPRSIDLGLMPAGWYRANLAIHNRGSDVINRQLDFAVVPEPAVQTVGGATKFGVRLPAGQPQRVPDLADLVARLGVAQVAVPMGAALFGHSRSPIEPAALRQTIEDLLAHRALVTFVIDEVPDRLAASLDVRPDQVLRVLAADPAVWQPQLDQLLLSFGRRVRHWQAGAAADQTLTTAAELTALHDRAAAALSTIIPGPQVIVPWPAQTVVEPSLDQAASASEQRSLAVAVIMPPMLAASEIESAMSGWRSTNTQVAVRLLAQPLEGDSARRRVANLAVGALAAWRAGSASLFIDAPWSIGDAPPQLSTGARERPGQPMPMPEFSPWRTLAAALDQRAFVGELPVGDGLRCWILRGAQGAPDALVAWNQSAPTDQAVMRSLLADGPVTVLDLFGNRRKVEPVDSRHEVALSDLPVFIEPIDHALAQFLAGWTIDPPFVTATRRPHELAIVLMNPWDVVISGQVRLNTDEPWQISPRASSFSIAPGQEARLPITVVLDSGVVAGVKRLDAEIEVQAARAYSLRLSAKLQVGLEDISLSPSWSIVANPRTGTQDLVVVLQVTNRGEGVAWLDAYLSGPGISPTRRPVGQLGPGQSAARTIQIAGGATALAGHALRVAIVDRSTTARLNQSIDIPVTAMSSAPMP